MDAVALRHLAVPVGLLPGDFDPFAVRPTVAVVAEERGSVIVDAGQRRAHAPEVPAATRDPGCPTPH